MQNNNILGTTGPYCHEQILWTDKKRPFLNWPISFTRYTLYKDRLLVNYGILFRRQSEIRLYRIKDNYVVQGPFQRLVRVGNIRLITADPSTPNYLLVGIKDPTVFALMLSNLAEHERMRVGVGMLETFGY